MRIVKIGKIDFNRHIIKAGECQAVKFESFELGGEVVDITEKQSVDKMYHSIHFKNGTTQDIFNVDRVYWVEEG
jgi:hypothetical protein